MPVYTWGQVPGTYFTRHIQVTGACPVTTDLIMRVNVRTTTTTSRPNNVAARILRGSFYALIGRGLWGGRQIGRINKIPKAAQSRYSPIFLPVLGPGWDQGEG